MNRIVVIGSLNADLVARVERAPGPGETVAGESFANFAGGKGANQAFAIGRLGGEAAMFGRVGSDANGRAQVANLASAGVSTKMVRELEGVSTGTAVIVVEGTGENRIVVVPGANGAYGLAEFGKDAGEIEGASHLLLQLEIPLETVETALERGRAAGVVTVLDPAPARVLPRSVLENVDILTPNLSELGELSGCSLDGKSSEAEIESAGRRLLDMGVGRLIAKLGTRGAMLVTGEGVTLVSGYKVKALDTTAAGDCFNGALAVALSDGRTVEEAMRFACAAAALSVTREGAQPSLPVREEVERLMGE